VCQGFGHIATDRQKSKKGDKIDECPSMKHINSALIYCAKKKAWNDYCTWNKVVIEQGKTLITKHEQMFRYEPSFDDTLGMVVNFKRKKKEEETEFQFPLTLTFSKKFLEELAMQENDPDNDGFLRYVYEIDLGLLEKKEGGTVTGYARAMFNKNEYT